MKRIIIFCLLCALLLACVPTPEQEYVVNKGDSTVEDKLNATPKPAEDPAHDRTETQDETAARAAQTFPDRWDAEPVEVLDGFTIAAHADVITKADGLYPVYKTLGAAFEKDQAIAYVKTVLGNPVAEGELIMTKEDWGKQLQSFLDDVEEQRQWVAAGKPDWGDRDETVLTDAEIEERSNWYMEQIKKAPDSVKTNAVHDYSGLQMGKQQIYSLENGTKAYVFAAPNWIIVSKTPGNGFIYDVVQHDEDWKYDDPNAKLWHDVTVSREDAEKKLQRELEKLDLSEFSIRSEREANLMYTSGDANQYASNGWKFELIRNPADYPTTEFSYEASQFLEYGEGSDFVVNKAIGKERIVVFIDKDGLQYFEYDHPKKITGIANPNVELLPFDEVQDRAIKSLTMCFPIKTVQGWYPGEVIPLEIYTMLLTGYTVRAKDGAGYYEMPCWIVFYDGWDYVANKLLGDSEEQIAEYRSQNRNDLRLQHDCLILNAVDGSVIHSGLGY